MTATNVQSIVPSNSEAERKATDDIIRDLAAKAGDGEVSRIEFFEKVTAAFVNDNLHHVVPDMPKSGKAPAVKIQHYAEHAVKLWNREFSKANKTDVSPLKASRVSELTTVFYAAQEGRRDIVTAAITAEKELKKAMAKLYGDGKGKAYAGRTYDAILKVARAQNAKIKKAKSPADRPLSDAELSGALLPKEASQIDEVDAVAKVIKAIEALAKEYPHNKDIYTAAAKGMTGLQSKLAQRAAYEKAQREKAENEAIIAAYEKAA